MEVSVRDTGMEGGRRVEEMVGPTSAYDRWVRWKSQSEIQVWKGGGEVWRGEGWVEGGRRGGLEVWE